MESNRNAQEIRTVRVYGSTTEGFPVIQCLLSDWTYPSAITEQNFHRETSICKQSKKKRKEGQNFTRVPSEPNFLKNASSMPPSRLWASHNFPAKSQAAREAENGSRVTVNFTYLTMLLLSYSEHYSTRFGTSLGWRTETPKRLKRLWHSFTWVVHCWASSFVKKEEPVPVNQAHFGHESQSCMTASVQSGI